jgi:hypothetical protein
MLAMGLRKLEAKKVVICKINANGIKSLDGMMGSLPKMTRSSQTHRTARYVRGRKYKDRTLIGALLRGKVRVDGRWRSRKIGLGQNLKPCPGELVSSGGVGMRGEKSHCRHAQEQMTPRTRVLEIVP